MHIIALSVLSHFVLLLWNPTAGLAYSSFMIYWQVLKTFPLDLRDNKRKNSSPSTEICDKTKSVAMSECKRARLSIIIPVTQAVFPLLPTMRVAMAVMLAMFLPVNCNAIKL